MKKAFFTFLRLSDTLFITYLRIRNTAEIHIIELMTKYCEKKLRIYAKIFNESLGVSIKSLTFALKIIAYIRRNF